MSRPRPIRYDQDTWLVMRNDPAIPKAVIQRVHHADGDQYLVFRWHLDPDKRRLMNVVSSLERADDLVRYDVPPSGVPPFTGYSEHRSAAKQFRDKDQQLRKEHERGH